MLKAALRATRLLPVRERCAKFARGEKAAMRYKKLRHGDIIKRGDEVRGVDGLWYATAFPRHIIGTYLTGGEYRHPIKPASRKLSPNKRITKPCQVCKGIRKQKTYGVFNYCPTCGRQLVVAAS
jgi:hypothetical protein